MSRIVSCISWDKATRRRLSHYSVRAVRIKKLSVHHFKDDISDKNLKLVTYFHYENRRFR